MPHLEIIEFILSELKISSFLNVLARTVFANEKVPSVLIVIAVPHSLSGVLKVQTLLLKKVYFCIIPTKGRSRDPKIF